MIQRVFVSFLYFLAAIAEGLFVADDATELTSLTEVQKTPEQNQRSTGIPTQHISHINFSVDQTLSELESLVASTTTSVVELPEEFDEAMEMNDSYLQNRSEGEVTLDTDISNNASSIKNHADIGELNLTDPSNSLVVNLSRNASMILDQDIKDEKGEETDLSSNFLSFEEWVQKKANGGQEKRMSNPSIKTLGNSHRTAAGDRESEYSIGEENEIDFDLFTPKQLADLSKENYKNRFNFASLDCAATIVKTNQGARGASSILMENKESYLLNQCNVNENFIIIELCEDILIDTITMGNYEFFSSIFKTLEFYVSDRYPVSLSEWKSLGRFDAKNIRDIQSFSIENPLIWARYLKIEIKSHYGNEFYCPVSIVRVHGRTMMEEYKLKESGEKNEAKKQILNKDNEGSESMGVDNNNIQQRMDSAANDKLDDLQSGSGQQYRDAGETIRKKDTSAFSTNIPKDDNSTQCTENKMYNGFEKFLAELKRNESCEPADLLESSTAANKAAVMALKLANSSNSGTFRPSTSVKRSEPSSQESIYKNIMNRLSLLESNASLSLLYIEEQSKLLGEAFSKLEKKQSSRFNMLVYAINETFQSQMNDFKTTFQIFKKESTSLLSEQEATNQMTYQKIDRNFSIMSNELQFQKRIVILLFVIVVCLLIYIILTRDTFIEGEYLDEVLDKEVARYRYLNNDDSAISINDDSSLMKNDGANPGSPNVNDSPIFLSSPQFTSFVSTQTLPTMRKVKSNDEYSPVTSTPTHSPSFKRRLKLKITNKLGTSASSTILLDDGYGHRKTSSSSSILSGLMDSVNYSGNNENHQISQTGESKSLSNLRTQVHQYNSDTNDGKARPLTPDASDTER
ncbi:Slp1 protein [Saccharomycopsis crataegensis]|uniref:SUN-like protein 1 n=1 Tax=Saccharomycopsis crataegensis TaxID=43959 RepID=A0AAV5QM08_9ASCO|nr:Slp1 protein [Saccharomycopsis crataegensis]